MMADVLRRAVQTTRCSSLLRRPRVGLTLIVIITAVTLPVVMFSSWNVCRPDLDDDVDVHLAASGSAGARRPDKICLSPVTDAGVRVNISLDSDDDLRRYNVNASADKPYTSIIHVMWNNFEVPVKWSSSAMSWVKINDKFVYCHWTLSELEAFVADRYPRLLPTYVDYPYFIQRCDVARYLLLYHYAGTYVDLDVSCLTPLSVIFRRAPVDAGVIVAPTEPFGVTTEFIAVRASRDPVIAWVISGLRRAAVSWWYPPLPYTAVMYRSGPVYFTRRLRCYRDQRRVFIMPSYMYYGLYVGHIEGGSWHRWDGRIIWTVFQFVRLLCENVGSLVALSTALLLFICIVRYRRLICRPDLIMYFMM